MSTSAHLPLLQPYDIEDEQQQVFSLTSLTAPEESRVVNRQTLTLKLGDSEWRLPLRISSMPGQPHCWQLSGPGQGKVATMAGQSLGESCFCWLGFVLQLGSAKRLLAAMLSALNPQPL